MVMAKLHIICGNCGCKDEFKFSEVQEAYDDGCHVEKYVSIVCENCSTIHAINDNLKKL